jgi:flagellar assembly protein FliH
MSTSARQAPVKAADIVSDNSEPVSSRIQPFPYNLIPSGPTPRPTIFDSFGDGASGRSTGDTHAEDMAAREAQARAQGRAEGLSEARQKFEDQLVRERASLAAALAQFTRDRAAYFQKVEGEVVQLALSIARKILHREAQLDPLLLAGIVRVALEKIDGATGVRLRVHPNNAADWRRYLTIHLDPADLPEIVEDSALEMDRCTLETSMGTAVIGLEPQLKEIEQGLMDLLAARPGAVS